MVITNDVSDYINLLLRIAHIICITLYSHLSGTLYALHPTGQAGSASAPGNFEAGTAQPV
jgi:hypothetical protein